jgi:magnesium-transporting ATPase (P-type)
MCCVLKAAATVLCHFDARRSAAGIDVEVAGALQRLELLAVLEFSSDRKRMSVVVRQHDGSGGGCDSSARGLTMSCWSG